jgi:hypothetical protein
MLFLIIERLIFLKNIKTTEKFMKYVQSATEKKMIKKNVIVIATK